MAKSADNRAIVRRHYVFDRLSLDQSAKLGGVSYATAKRWKTQAATSGDDWDRVRAAATMAGGDIEQMSRQILTDMLVQFQAVLEIIKADADMKSERRVELLSSLMDNIHKSMSAMKRFLPETSALATGMIVIRGLAEFVQAKFPQHGSVFVEILEPFGDVLPGILDKAK